MFEKMVLVKNNNHVIEVNYEDYLCADTNFNKHLNSAINLHDFCIRKARLLINSYIQFLVVNDSFDENFNSLLGSCNNDCFGLPKIGIDWIDDDLELIFNTIPKDTVYVLRFELYYNKFLNSLNELGVEEIINYVDEMPLEFDGIKFDDDMIISAFKKALYSELFYKKKHLCASCSNASVGKCSKIRSRVKRDIYDYSFINCGYEVKEKINCDRFVVLDCHNYEDEIKRR